MGVFKNEVGRPSNETIKKRNIFKGICVLFVVVIICLIAYIVNDKLNVKNTNQPNNKTANESNYKDYDFVKSTSVKAYLTDTTTLEFVYVDVMIKNGSIIVKNEAGEEFNDNIINNAKYITTFNNAIHDPESSIAVLTSTGELYVATSVNNYKIDFNRVEYGNKIKELYIVNEYDQRAYATNMLYILNDKEELLNVKYDGLSDSNYKIEGKFEERIVYISGTDAVYYSGELDVKSGILKLYINESLQTIKFDGKEVKVKYLFKNYDDVGNEGIFIITNDDKIITTEKKGDFSQYSDGKYKFVLHSNLKVTNIIKTTSDYTSSIKVTYEDNSEETFYYVSQTYNISTIK